MRKFEFAVKGKNPLLYIIVFIALFFLLQYFFRNPLITLITVAVMLIFVLISMLFSKKAIMKIYPDHILFIDEKGQKINIPRKLLIINKVKWKQTLSGYGPAIIFLNYKDLTFGTSETSFKWKNEIGKINKLNYFINESDWKSFIKELNLDV